MATPQLYSSTVFSPSLPSRLPNGHNKIPGVPNHYISTSQEAGGRKVHNGFPPRSEKPGECSFELQ